MKSRWEKEFTSQQRSLEEVERRNVITGGGTLSDESVVKCIAADADWKRPSRMDIWADRAVMFVIAHIDRGAIFLIGFFLGYVVSALRG